jgi:chemotaxis protein methyltransferase CheR
MAMKSADFDYVVKMVYEKSGIHLTADKAYLVESRLTPLARKRNFAGLDEFLLDLRTKPDAKLVSDIIEAMTTNESSFFRDQKPFDQFRQVILPRLLEIRRDRKTIRIWSAACSSGQEPYSLAMILHEERAKMLGWRTEIVATDISQEIVDKAKTGCYSQFEVQRGMPIQSLVKYFSQDGDHWTLHDELRRMVTFKLFNLMDDPTSLGVFDVVFLRNVLIYFDQPTKAKVLEKISRRMPSDGLLVLGGAETVIGVSDRFKPHEDQRGVYKVVSNGPPGSTILVNQMAQA